MHHPHPIFDEAFLEQIAAQLSKQRGELDRLRRAVSPRPDEKSNLWAATLRACHLGLSLRRPRGIQRRDNDSARDH